ncbi:hypothetical protein EWN99_24695 [Salmonella enterica]|nr:hypothetical protein [Salmonella enterica]EBS3177507.1 hypothetical protein [Salmonella enterica subsp. enterica serovar Newport]EBS3869794.1 hypothetical protein [Salmonella enterica subsp. enterica serovar Kimberley]
MLLKCLLHRASSALRKTDETDDADDILTVSTANKKEIAKAREHHKSRLAGTIRQIKKVLQRSQYRKAVEALCKKCVRNCFTCLHKPKHMLPKTPDRVEIRRNNLSTAF